MYEYLLLSKDDLALGECMKEGRKGGVMECADIEFKEEIAVEESLPVSKPQGP